MGSLTNGILYPKKKRSKDKPLLLPAHPVPDDSPLNTDLSDEEVFTVEAGFHFQSGKLTLAAHPEQNKLKIKLQRPVQAQELYSSHNRKALYISPLLY